MYQSEFESIFDQQVEKCTNVLIAKAHEYATADRLANFKSAAHLQNTTLRQALAGMQAKHIVSIFDMCSSGEDYDMDLWDEKLTDALNYFFLLKAILIEERKDQSDIMLNPIQGELQHSILEIRT